jgi:hypothetical protein
MATAAVRRTDCIRRSFAVRPGGTLLATTWELPRRATGPRSAK